MSLSPIFRSFSIDLLAVLVIAGAGSIASAHPDHDAKPRAYDLADHFRPTPIPDRVVLTWSDDPATTIDITYRTAPGVEPTLCQWVEASRILGDHASGAVPESEQTEGTSEPFTSDRGDCLMHSIALRKLAPETRYAYRVGDGVNWSEWHHYTTASRDAKPFEFLYFGDAQNAVRALWSRVRREAHADAPRAAFALHAGDLINASNADTEWGEWHGAAGWLNATVPTVATPGNHEYFIRKLQLTVSDHWRPQFSFPLNGPEGLEETCYWFDYQGTRFISLNSNEKQEEQAEWLDRTLSDLPPARWTIVTFHHPIFAAAKNRDNSTLRELWKPIFDKHQVDLALTGHDHAYARSGLGGPGDQMVGAENAGEGVSTKEGKTVYVVSVSGPKSYPLGQAWDEPRSGSGIQLYQVISVDTGSIRYRAFCASGELYDAFTIEKDVDGAVELIEQAPETPEIRK
ncbi:Alkaline phosphatase precursor [Botrimarina colliarenosi]|uniref:Alkaline phosphatase n=1 Tax=Botrimarina colliarenosi TaxID=2528001 RepID=A0A5C6AKH0_9BACT|nr:metallophosphoesterase family protein [Botrimarina colliarenosi]TWT99511.1 Alkaline phosphatase precursor [Botrimarina colliarenosi]